MTRAFYTSHAGGSFAEWVEGAIRDGFGVPVLAWRTLPTEASFRSFYRVESDAGSHVAMYAPPEHENTRQFVKIAELFSREGIGVPDLHAFDLDLGFVLMEDLGDELLESAYARGQSTPAVELALRTLVTIQSTRDAEGSVPPYEEQRFHMELGIFSEWFLQGLLKTPPPTWYASLSEQLVASALSQPRCCIHRDFHCRNLLIKPSGELGVVDFQDALIGPLTYDLASMLGDCYYEFDEAQVSRFIKLYRGMTHDAEFSRLGDDELRLRFDLMVIQRQLKAVGIFSRLWLMRGRKSHLGDITPVLGRLAKRARQHAETAPLADAIAGEYLPLAATQLERIHA